ncbi:MAG: hypothetical protein EOP87_26580, partial [Verrucomicrobiaceae bacterium]
MDRSQHSGTSQQIIEIVFPHGRSTNPIMTCHPRDSGISTCRDDSGRLWLLDGGLSTDWISLSALVDETISAGADVAVFSVAAHNAGKPETGKEGIAMIREEWIDRILANAAASRCLAENWIAGAAKSLDPDARILEWSKDQRFRRHFHPDYPNCGNSPVVPGIRFPVIDAGIREATCEQYLDLAERMGSRVVRYEGDKMRGWFLDDCTRWQDLFGMDEAARVLEIGATDGVNTNAMLDMLFPHPASEVHSVRVDDDVDLEGFFEKNAAVAGREGRLHLYDGEAVEILAWMISTEGYWESFDFVHLKPVREPLAALTAACQA